MVRIRSHPTHAKQGLRRRLGRAHLGRDMEDQPAQAALVANLRHPDYVHVVCGTLEELPQAFAVLNQQGVTGSSPLQRTNRDTALRRHIRAWARDTDQHSDAPSDPLMRPDPQVSNGILTR